MMNLNQLHALTTDRGKENFKKLQNEKKYQQHTEEALYTKLHYTQIVSKIFFIPNRFAAENIAFFVAETDQKTIITIVITCAVSLSKKPSSCLNLCLFQNVT